MQTKPLININANEPVPELEGKYNKWYDEVHIPIVLKNPALLGLTRYKIVTGISDPSHPGLAEPKEGYARYLTIYDFENEETFRAFDQSPEMKEALEDLTRTWRSGELTVKFRAQYKPRRTWEGKVKAPMGMIHMVGPTVPPQVEDEFNHWYDEIHIPVLLRDPRLLGLTRYKIVTGIAHPDHPHSTGPGEAYPKYLTIYNFESPESFRAYDHSPEMNAENEEWEKMRESWNPGATKVLMRAQYTPIRTWTR